MGNDCGKNDDGSDVPILLDRTHDSVCFERRMTG